MKVAENVFMDSISQMKNFWPDWTVVDKVGAGSYGHVYKVKRSVAGKTYYSAVKVITVPQNESEVKAVYAEEGSHSATKEHFRALVDDCIREITIMMDLRGTANVVEVEDFQVVEYEKEIRWDIFIRMEYLTCLTDIIPERKFSEKETAKLGVDLCSALELCGKKQIIHRDIKPGNIFVSEFGTYKLGDFGIARQMDRASGTLSSRGTYDYMAPEMFKGMRYDATVDLYALGIVLYKLMNRNRAPFLDPEAARITSEDKEAALGKRISGENLPAPCDASVPMSIIILKACRADPTDRFRTPGQMKTHLENILNDRTDLIMRAAENNFSDQVSFIPNSGVDDENDDREKSRTVMYPADEQSDSDLNDMGRRERGLNPSQADENPVLDPARPNFERSDDKKYGGNREKISLVPIICGIALLAVVFCVAFIYLPKLMQGHSDQESSSEETDMSRQPTKLPDILVTVTPTPPPTSAPTSTPASTPDPTPLPTAIPTSPPVQTEAPAPTVAPAPANEPSGQTITIVGGIEAPIEDFVFYFSSQRKITEDELNSMTPSGRADTNIDEMSFDDKQIRLNISQIAIDEIYARHGWTVADSDEPSIADLYARDYLFSLDWYRRANNLYLSGGVSEYDAQLTEIEKENIEALYWWQHMYWNE